MQSEHGERVAMTFSFTTFSCSLRRTHRSAICIDRCPVRAILAVSSASSLCFFFVSLHFHVFIAPRCWVCSAGVPETGQETVGQGVSA